MSDVFITQEEDGSQWVSLEDYITLRGKFREFLNTVYEVVSVQCNDVGEAHAGLLEEISVIRESGLTKRAADECPALIYGRHNFRVKDNSEICVHCGTRR